MNNNRHEVKKNTGRKRDYSGERKLQNTLELL